MLPTIAGTTHQSKVWGNVINLDEYDENDKMIHFGSFSVEHFPKTIKKSTCNNDVIANLIQSYDSIMYEFFCVEFIDFMLDNKTLTDFSNLFSPNILKKMIKKYLNFVSDLIKYKNARFRNVK